MDVLIIGCGRVGAAVAAALSDRYQVTVVDWNVRSLDRLPVDFRGRSVVGNGIDADVLGSAGAAGADLVLALTDLDNANLMAAQVASHLGARRVVARVYDSVRAEVFAGMGVHTVSPTVAAARSLFELVTGA